MINFNFNKIWTSTSKVLSLKVHPVSDVFTCVLFGQIMKSSDLKAETSWYRGFLCEKHDSDVRFYVRPPEHIQMEKILRKIPFLGHF